MKKGFTLIELLAVIVILAIIALIATPMVLGVIEKANKGAAKSSAYGYVKALELKVAEVKMDGTNYGATTMSDTTYVTDLKGEKPSAMSLTLSDAGAVTGGWVAIQGYVIGFDANGEATVGAATN